MASNQRTQQSNSDEGTDLNQPTTMPPNSAVDAGQTSSSTSPPLAANPEASNNNNDDAQRTDGDDADVDYELDTYDSYDDDDDDDEHDIAADGGTANEVAADAALLTAVAGSDSDNHQAMSILSAASAQLDIMSTLDGRTLTVPPRPSVLNSILADVLLNTTNGGEVTADTVESLRQIVERYEQTFNQFRTETESAIAKIHQQFSDIRRKFETLKRIRQSLMHDLNGGGGSSVGGAGVGLSTAGRAGSSSAAFVRSVTISGGGGGGGGVSSMAAVAPSAAAASVVVAAASARSAEHAVRQVINASFGGGVGSRRRAGAGDSWFSVSGGGGGGGGAAHRSGGGGQSLAGQLGLAMGRSQAAVNRAAAAANGGGGGGGGGGGAVRRKRWGKKSSVRRRYDRD